MCIFLSMEYTYIHDTYSYIDICIDIQSIGHTDRFGGIITTFVKQMYDNSKIIYKWINIKEEAILLKIMSKYS